MKILKGDIWEYGKEMGYVVIPTNGCIKNNGSNVMGKGLALEASQRYPELPKIVGKHIKDNGNEILVYRAKWLITFPTKKYWWKPSDLELLHVSAFNLGNLIKECDFLKEYPIFMPKVGCGNGQLNWSDVEPILKMYCPNVIIVDRR